MKIVIGIGVLLAVLVGVALLLPFIVDLNKYQEQYRPLIEEALNRKVTLEDIRLTIWPRLGARVAGFTDRVSLAGGKVTYRDFSQGKPVEYALQDMEFLLQSVHLGMSPSLHLALTIQPMNLPVSLDGTFGPLKETADLDAVNLQLALGKTAVAITGKTAGSHMAFTVTAPSIDTANVPAALPLKKPVELKDVKVAAEVKGQDLRLTDLSFHVFEGKVAAQGGLTSGAVAPPFNGKVTLDGLQLGPALDAVADVPVSVTGTAGATLSLKGQGFAMPDLTRALEGVGHVGVKDGKIDGVNLLQEAVSILKVVGISVGEAKATAFSTIETDLVVKQGVVSLQNMLMDSHDFQATGGGTIGFDHALNMTVNLRLSEALSQQVAGSSPVARLAIKEGRLTLPLLIGGTLDAPSYGLDMKGLTGKVQEQIKQKAEEAIGGLLKGTTKPKDLEQEGKQLLKGLFGR